MTSKSKAVKKSKRAATYDVKRITVYDVKTYGRLPSLPRGNVWPLTTSKRLAYDCFCDQDQIHHIYKW